MEPHPTGPSAIQSFTELNITYSFEPNPTLKLVRPCVYYWFHTLTKTQGERTIFLDNRDDIYKLVNYWNKSSNAAWKYVAE